MLCYCYMFIHSIYLHVTDSDIQNKQCPRCCLKCVTFYRCLEIEMLEKQTDTITMYKLVKQKANIRIKSIELPPTPLDWLLFWSQMNNRTGERRNILYERNKFASIGWMFRITNYHFNGAKKGITLNACILSFSLIA